MNTSNIESCTNQSANIHGDDDIRIEKNQNGTETYIFDPYNPLNVVIQPNDIQEILKKYGIDLEIANFTLYKRAFIHRSYIRRPNIENQHNNIVIVDQPSDCLPLYTKSNERLEYVGDGVLECITKYYLYWRFPKKDEGFMTEKKIALVKNEAIGKIAMEMGLHKWFILSKHAELKQTRTNLKKLGCLFEAFIGAIFLDFNKLPVKDEDGWFENIFDIGPGFQMAFLFVKNVFEKHVNWINLIRDDNNFKNKLQVKIQKEFKVTPHYMEINNHTSETGYHMGVFLCLGQQIHSVSITDYLSCSKFKSFQEIHEYMSIHNKIFLFLGEGKHKIKKKAEQIACEEAMNQLEGY